MSTSTRNNTQGCGCSIIVWIFCLVYMLIYGDRNGEFPFWLRICLSFVIPIIVIISTTTSKEIACVMFFILAGVISSAFIMYATNAIGFSIFYLLVVGLVCVVAYVMSGNDCGND